MKADRLLEDIKSRLDIVEVIGDYVELKKAGQNYKGLCPFHSEKTPSFIVSPGKQIFHCFGCGTGGDVVGFVMKHENFSFHEAIKLLAKQAGIKLSGYRFDSEAAEKRERLQDIQREALNLFVENLKKSKTATAYLSGRGLSGNTISSFSLGYATKDWHSLYKHLKDRGFDDSLIGQSGLVFYGEKGAHDIFRNRIIFPIFNIHGDVTAFGGRVMDDAQPKYLNSQETPLFKKGETLYAIHLAKDEIRKKDYAIIVEGYLDVIMCHQHGFKNAVAALGTALTAGHLQKLGRFTKKALLIFDGDEAGIAAAKRSISLLFEHGFRAKVLLLPQGEDPDSFLRENGAQPFRTMLTKAKSMVDFLFSTSRGERVDIVKEAAGIISNVKDLILRDELVRELSDRARVRESVIHEEMKKLKQGAGISKSDERSGTVNRRGSLYNEELLLLSAAIACPHRASEIIDRIPVDEVEDQTIKGLFQKIKAIADKVSIDLMLSVADNDEKMLITRLSLNPGFDLENVDKNVDDCIRKIIQRRFDERVRIAETAGDLKLLNSLLLERQRLIKGTR